MTEIEEKKYAFDAAVAFSDRYPFTRFMSGKHIDYESTLLRRGVNVNVYLIGFGKINQAVFLTSTEVNQFLTADADDNPVPKKVRYYIFDRAATKKKKIFSDTYYRYDDFRVGVNRKDYFPLPAPAAEEEYIDCEIGSKEFYENLRGLSEKDVNIAVVSLGDRSENIRAARLIKKRFGEKIDVIANAEKAENGIYAFGDGEYDCHIIAMAKNRNAIYDLEYLAASGEKVSEEDFEKVKQSAEKHWEEMTDFDRGANIMSVLGVRVKLNLLGLDYCDKSADGLPLSEKEYMSVYAKDDMPKYQPYTVCGRKVVKYDARFQPSARTNLAMQEHERWNAYMLCHGFVPSGKDCIMRDTAVRNGKTVYTNGKDFKARRHGNLTTFDGLKEYAAMTAKRDNCDEIQKDVIKYDCQLMDGLHGLLDDFGYKIVQRK